MSNQIFKSEFQSFYLPRIIPCLAVFIMFLILGVLIFFINFDCGNHPEIYFKQKYDNPMFQCEGCENLQSGINARVEKLRLYFIPILIIGAISVIILLTKINKEDKKFIIIPTILMTAPSLYYCCLAISLIAYAIRTGCI